jgi:hypothetical protein
MWSEIGRKITVSSRLQTSDKQGELLRGQGTIMFVGEHLDTGCAYVSQVWYTIETTYLHIEIHVKPPP